MKFKCDSSVNIQSHETWRESLLWKIKRSLQNISKITRAGRNAAVLEKKAER